MLSVSNFSCRSLAAEAANISSGAAEAKAKELAKKVVSVCYSWLVLSKCARPDPCTSCQEDAVFWGYRLVVS
jgi:hypothetical protein